MEDNERQLIVEQLVASEECLLEVVAGLTEEQWRFRETPERWSIAENVEHLVVFKDFIRGVVEAALMAPSEPENRDRSSGKQASIYELADPQGAKLQCRAAVRPAGRWADMAQAVFEFRKTRALILAFSCETEADLRSRFFAHLSLGDLDCCQWLLLLSQHALRHVQQIAEIKANVDYPVFPLRR